jgi:hypothetical protein
MEHVNFARLLLAGNAEAARRNARVRDAVYDQESFDQLFTLIFHHERALVLRAATAVEKITLRHPEYLHPHKQQLLQILNSADHRELKRSVAVLISRVGLEEHEATEVWNTLKYETLNRNERKTIRASALQGLSNLAKQFPEFNGELRRIVDSMKHEPIPSIQARVRKLTTTRSLTELSRSKKSK